MQVSKGKSSTASANKGTKFVFTNFKPTDYKKIYEEFSDIIRAVAIGHEVCPSTGREHDQGFIQMFKQCRYSKIQKIFNSKCHFEVMHGSIKENEKYCSKDGFYTTYGHFVTQGYRSDLHNIKDDLNNGASLYDIMNNYTGDFVRYHAGIEKMKSLIDKKKTKKWRHVDVTVLIGSAGSGKTSFVAKKHGYENIFNLNLECDRFMFDGYDNEDVLLIDDFNGGIKYTQLLRILDGHPLPLNVKNGRRYANFTKVYITSNVKPCYWYNNIYDNLKRRLKNCLEVTKGNTEDLSHPFEKDCDLSDSEFVIEYD